MVGDKVMAKHKLDLGNIGDRLAELGIRHTAVEPSEGMPLHSLYFELPSELKSDSWKIVFSFLPTSEEDLYDIKLLQCYVEVLAKEGIDQLTQELMGNVFNHLNNGILFGKYALIDDNIVYRYVLNLGQYDELDKNFTSSFLKMLIYNIESGYQEIVSINRSDK